MKTESPTKKQVGIWLRVSTDDQARGESPEHHEKRARLYAEARGWDVTTVYHLEGVSGKSVMGNAECKRMLKDVRSGAITGLIFSKLARLARNVRELLDFKDIFRESSADMISLQDSIDTSTPSGRLFYTMVAGFAEWEREEITDRINASVAIRAKLGKPLNCKAPFGYVYKDKKLVPHPDEAPIRKKMYEIFLKTRRVRTTARMLNDAGYRTRIGAKFDYTSVKRLLLNPTAKGVQIINFSRNVGRNKTWKLKPESEWQTIGVEPIIPEETWDAVNRILKDRKDSFKRPGKTPMQLFAGILHCECNQRMYVPSNTPKYVCSRCKRKIPVGDIEEIFVEQLKGFFLSTEDIKKHLANADSLLAEKQAGLQSHRANLEKVKLEVNRVYDLYLSHQIDADGFGRFYKPLQERRAQLEAEEPRLQAEIDLVKIDHLSAEEVMVEARDLYGRWTDLTFEEKRRVIESVTEKIVLGKQEVSITLCATNSCEDMTKRQRSLNDVGSGTVCA